MSEISKYLRKIKNENNLICLQVWTVLESLDRDYKRDEDWCSSDKTPHRDTQAKAAYLLQLINKHSEQKESFLRVNTSTCLYYH